HVFVRTRTLLGPGEPKSRESPRGGADANLVTWERGSSPSLAHQHVRSAGAAVHLGLHGSGILSRAACDSRSAGTAWGRLSRDGSSGSRARLGSRRWSDFARRGSRAPEERRLAASFDRCRRAGAGTYQI